MATSPPLSSPTSVFTSLRRKSISKAATNAEAREKRETAVKEAKQYVRNVVRADWSFEPPATLWTTPSSPDSHILTTTAAAAAAAAVTTPTAMTSETSETANITAADGLQLPKVTEWRPREPGSSESDSDLDPALRKAIESHQKRKGDPYRFENPDAIKTSVLDRGRRRRADLEQEMKWNPGLRFYIERRNAWTGARKRRDAEKRAANQRQGSGHDGSSSRELSRAECRHVGGNGSETTTTTPTLTQDAASPTSGHSREMFEDLSLTENPGRATSKTAAKSRTAHHGLESESGHDTTIDGYEADRSYDSDESVIPVMESFIEDTNCVRSSIKPNLYASLYSKVIVQGLTPSIPINLSDVTKALVAGWKADGQWPPKPTVPLPGSDVPARKKGSKAQSSTKSEDIAVSGMTGARPSNNNINNSTGRKTSFSNQATSAVKKVLGLSNHSFHLRRSSRSSANGDSALADRSSSIVDEVPADGLLVEEPQPTEGGRHRHNPFAS